MTELVARIGADHAQATWDAGPAAIAQIDRAIFDENIACDFAWVPGYLHRPPGVASTDAGSRFESKCEDEATATGFSGNGMTFGTLGAMMMARWVG